MTLQSEATILLQLANEIQETQKNSKGHIHGKKLNKMFDMYVNELSKIGCSKQISLHLCRVLANEYKVIA